MEPTISAPTQPLDVEQLTLGGLQRLQADVEAAIQLKREEKQTAALAEIASLVGEAELDPDQVNRHLTKTTSRKTKRTKLPPKYRDPDTPSDCWAGRGKRPRWLQAKLENGAMLEDFLIDAVEGGE